MHCSGRARGWREGGNLSLPVLIRPEVVLKDGWDFPFQQLLRLLNPSPTYHLFSEPLGYNVINKYYSSLLQTFFKVYAETIQGFLVYLIISKVVWGCYVYSSHYNSLAQHVVPQFVSSLNFLFKNSCHPRTTSPRSSLHPSLILFQNSCHPTTRSSWYYLLWNDMNIGT